MKTRTLTRGALSFTAHTWGFDANASGDIVLCLHGFPDNPHTFHKQAPALCAAGYRVIAPTMRGYEPSSQPPDGDYTLGALARDTIAWAKSLTDAPVHLLGHDWGAAVTYLAGALAPERFLSLATIAVPHVARLPTAARKVPIQFLRSWYMTFFQLRGLAEWSLETGDWWLMRRLWRQWSPQYTPTTDEWAQRMATFSAPGVNRAMLSYYRQNASPRAMLGLSRTEASTLTTVPLSTLAITGSDDRCIDTRLYEHLFHPHDFPAGFRIERIHGAGHFAHLEEPEAINTLLLSWFAQHTRRP